MKVFVTGKGGQLAHACLSIWPKARGLTAAELDITDESAVAELPLDEHSVLINTAAFTDTEQAEHEFQTAFLVNATGPLVLARQVASANATLVHISTDYVFDGRGPEYLEDAPINPLNVYGLSKYAGEQAVRMYTKRHYIIRTSGLFGPSGQKSDNNFVYKRFVQLQNNRSIEMVDDQFMVPTYTLSLANAIKALLEQKAPFGTYHIVNSGSSVSWYGFTERIIKVAHMVGSLTPKQTEHKEGMMRRPLHSVLSTKKLNALGISLPTWESDLSAYMETLQN